MIYILLFIVEIALLVRIDRQLWGTFFTPLTCLSIPTAAVIFISIIASCSISDYYPFYFPSLVVWMVGLLIFALPSWILFGKVSLKNIRLKSKDLYIIESHSLRSREAYKILTAFTILLLIFAFIKMPSPGTSTWGSDEFSSEYSSNGMLLNHINVCLSVMLCYYIYIADRSRRMAFAIIGLCLIDMYAIGVKSWIIAPCIIGYYARLITGKSKFSYKSFLIIAFAGMLVFALSYILLMVGTGKSEFNGKFFTFLINHFVSYIAGAPLTFSIDFQKGIQEPYLFQSLFAPLINIKNLIFGGEPVIHINPTWISFGPNESNVRTFLGTIFAFTHSWVGFVIVVLVFSFYNYILYSVAINSKNPFMIIANCTNLGFLTLGFFEFYWLNLAPYEMLVMCLILAFFYKYWPVNKMIGCRRVISE